MAGIGGNPGLESLTTFDGVVILRGSLESFLIAEFDPIPSQSVHAFEGLPPRVPHAGAGKVSELYVTGGHFGNLRGCVLSALKTMLSARELSTSSGLRSWRLGGISTA